MARIVAQSAFLSANAAYFCVDRWYMLMQDGTMWSFSVSGGVKWTQAPAIPGARTVSSISAEAALFPPMVDTVYASCTDGTIWGAAVTTPFVWTQVATTPP